MKRPLSHVPDRKLILLSVRPKPWPARIARELARELEIRHDERLERKAA